MLTRSVTIWRLAALLLVVTGLIAGVTGYVLKKSRPSQITISLTGDIMLSRGVGQYLDEYGFDYPYDEVREIFLQDDWTIGNLECPITGLENAADKTKRFVFRADEENAAALARAGYDCLVLANNHSMDYLSGGLYDTMMNLKKNGLTTAGAVENSTGDSACIFQKNGITVGLLAYSAFPPEGFFYNRDKPSVQYISTMNVNRLEPDLAALADCDFTIVYFHWGVEYAPYRSESQEIMARAAIDAGADFVVGTHPHVLQDTEVYNGKYIYYSLGNFVFDKQIPPGTDESMILQLTITKDGLAGLEEIPVTIEAGRPVIVSSLIVLQKYSWLSSHQSNKKRRWDRFWLSRRLHSLCLNRN